jgi:hypothetical protein
MGKVLGPYNTFVYGIHSKGDPVQSNILTLHKMDARNGGTRQRLSRQREKAARPYASAGRMAQEANAQGNAWDMGECQRHSLKPSEGWPLT